MKKKYLSYLAAGALYVPLTCCTPPPAEEYSWKDELNDELPLLGHRNWIVITDMAYPLQTQAGIKTLFADEPYMEILTHVYDELEKAPHVKPVIYRDKELLFLSDKDASGVDALKKDMGNLSCSPINFVPHEELIARLDEASRMFHVIVIKSNLTIPYTSTFIELDCAYWDSSSQQALDERMKTNR
jgi:D-ribose pyranose/furanose isomerase RbsD